MVFFFFYDLVSVSIEESIVIIVCATWGFSREFLVLILKIFNTIFKLVSSDVGTSEVSEKIFMSLVLTVSYLSSPIVAFTNCSSRVVRFVDFYRRYTNRSSDHIVPWLFVL